MGVWQLAVIYVLTLGFIVAAYLIGARDGRKDRSRRAGADKA